MDSCVVRARSAHLLLSTTGHERVLFFLQISFARANTMNGAANDSKKVSCHPIRGLHEKRYC